MSNLMQLQGAALPELPLSPAKRFRISPQQSTPFT
jgi:hypothetical protein